MNSKIFQFNYFAFLIGLTFAAILLVFIYFGSNSLRDFDPALRGFAITSVLGAFAYLLYGNIQLGYVMTAAMILNLILSAIMGVMIPLILNRLGKDPAVGSSVLITAMTDSGGFFIFLGLATIVLL